MWEFVSFPVAEIFLVCIAELKIQFFWRPTLWLPLEISSRKLKCFLVTENTWRCRIGKNLKSCMTKKGGEARSASWTPCFQWSCFYFMFFFQTSLVQQLTWCGEHRILEWCKTSIYHQIMSANILGIIGCKVECSISYIIWLTICSL